MEFIVKIRDSPNQRRGDSDLSSTLMNLPCDVRQEGPVNADERFLACIHPTEGSELRTSLRGHGLVGKLEDIPLGHAGVIFQQKDVRMKVAEASHGRILSWGWNDHAQPDGVLGAVKDFLDVAMLVHHCEMDC